MRRVSSVVAVVFMSACSGGGASPGSPIDADVKSSMEISGPRVGVWIDTDPSIRTGGHEVDDGFALIQAFHSSELDIRGISLVFGNSTIDVEIPIAEEILRKFGPPGLEAFVGAAGPEDLGHETPASEALAQALRREPLRILVLGPGTNIGTVLIQHPELADRMVELVAVAGRRPGQRFVVGDFKNRNLCDCNFDKDPDAFQVILDSGVPLTLTPWEISSHVWLRAEDLDRLAQGPPAAQWLVPAARDWLGFWQEGFGVDGFNPFDTLAVGYMTSPELISCDVLPVEIRLLPDDQVLAGGQDDVSDKPYLLASQDLESETEVRYCHTPAKSFVSDLTERLLVEVG